MQIVVQELLTHYEQQGHGPTILLIHGWADRLETFQAILPELVRRYSVVSLDLPGFGQSEPPKEVWNLDQYASFVAEFLKKLRVQDHLLAIVGHSNGAAVVIRGAALGELRAEKLVLLSASGVRNIGKVRRFIVGLIAKIGKLATFWLPQASRQKLQKKFYGTIGSDMLVKPEMQETFKVTVRQDIQTDAAKIDTPTLLIYGDQDRATPVQKIGRRLQQLIPGSSLKVIAGAEHFIHQTNPHQVTAYILEFLS